MTKPSAFPPFPLPVGSIARFELWAPAPVGPAILRTTRVCRVIEVRDDLAVVEPLRAWTLGDVFEVDSTLIIRSPFARIAMFIRSLAPSWSTRRRLFHLCHRS